MIKQKRLSKISLYQYIKETYKYLLPRFLGKKTGLNPVIMEDVYNFKNLAYNFQNAETLNRSNVNSVKYGTETITSLGAKFGKFCLMTIKS